ncbi:hypothetical protein N7494_008044 [Penicillium frequentans]|uniref:Uncharacterized protein n=1 Tax=Penicillium frequentans TaxID=3151616 RepID=A0AAD6CTR1_9EURO|nr:hypothetical protein N7494_008044 [Penicillium glabrum]
MTALMNVDGGESGLPPTLAQTLSSVKNAIASPMRVSRGERTIHGFKWILVVIAILSSHLLFALDNTIVANIQAVGYSHSILTRES